MQSGRPPTVSNRTRSGRRLLAGAGICSGIAAAYFVAAGWVIFSLKIGPVVTSINPQASQGIHSGDSLGVVFALVGGVFAAAAAALVNQAVHPPRTLAPLRVRATTRSRRAGSGSR